jgi:sulfide:quinone oxidoreductase
MRNLLILGAGTAGTMAANRLRRRLGDDWSVTVVDRDDRHPYQPGYLFVPFDGASTGHLVRSRHAYIADRVDFLVAEVDRVIADDNVVLLADGRRLEYDYLVVASGVSPRPDMTPGLLGEQWRRSIFDFYTLEGAEALRDALLRFDHGRLVVHVAETPIKCPVAPLEFCFLADSWLRRRGARDRVELVYATPLSGAFTRPVAAEHLGRMLDERKIAVEADFLVEHVDDESRELVSYDERRIPFDLLVTVPVNMGADFIGSSGLGDELNLVPVDPHTLLSRKHDNVFAIGDASDIPASKAGSTAHYAVEVLVDNFMDHTAGRPMRRRFDGHANCFVEAGDDKALLIDFDYDAEPLPGRFPFPVVGPLALMKATRLNHLGKLAFQWVYWNVLLPGRPLPLPGSRRSPRQDDRPATPAGTQRQES